MVRFSSRTRYCSPSAQLEFSRSELDEIDVDSGGSADEDENDFTDADAAIDRMLDELQDFQFVSTLRTFMFHCTRGLETFSLCAYYERGK